MGAISSNITATITRGVAGQIGFAGSARPVATRVAETLAGPGADALRGARIAVLEHPTTHAAATKVAESLRRLASDAQVGVELIDEPELHRFVGTRYPGTVPLFDGVVTYTGAMLGEDSLRMLRLLADDQSVAVLNGADAIFASRDKLLSGWRFHRNNIPTPQTVPMLGRSGVEQALQTVGTPAVIKLPIGTEGAEVALISDAAEALEFMRMAPDELWLAQAKISPVGRDVRAVVVRDGAEHRLVTAMERQGKDFHANISQGGSGTHIALHPDDANTAIRATRHLGLDFSGVDLMGEPGRMSVIEANSGLGLVVEDITGVNVSEHIAATALDATRGARLHTLGLA